MAKKKTDDIFDLYERLKPFLGGAGSDSGVSPWNSPTPIAPQQYGGPQGPAQTNQYMPSPPTREFMGPSLPMTTPPPPKDPNAPNRPFSDIPVYNGQPPQRSPSPLFKDRWGTQPVQPSGRVSEGNVYADWLKLSLSEAMTNETNLMNSLAARFQDPNGQQMSWRSFLDNSPGNMQGQLTPQERQQMMWAREAIMNHPQNHRYGRMTMGASGPIPTNPLG